MQKLKNLIKYVTNNTSPVKISHRFHKITAQKQTGTLETDAATNLLLRSGEFSYWDCKV
jgi:hypothetical protein